MSTEPLDDAALAEIEARCDAASDGPWDWWTAGEGRLEMFIPDGTMGAEVLLSYADFRDCEDCGRPSHGDMNFIVMARTDVPALVAALRAERAKTADQLAEQ